MDRPRRPITDDDGFILLLAFFGALVLLLSSLSLQTVALQSRSSEWLLRLRRQREDALFSAAQLVVGRLPQHRCLLQLPLSDWTKPPIAAQQCSTASDRQALLHGQLPPPDDAAGRFTVVGFEPVYRVDAAVSEPIAVLDAADLTLEWKPNRGGSTQRRFRLQLQPGADVLQPPLLRGLQP